MKFLKDMVEKEGFFATIMQCVIFLLFVGGILRIYFSSESQQSKEIYCKRASTIESIQIVNPFGDNPDPIPLDYDSYYSFCLKVKNNQ